MTQKNSERTEDQIELFSYSPLIILRDVLKKWYLILAAALIVGMGCYVFAEVHYVPEYTTTTTFVVTQQGSSTTVFENLSATSSLASVFSEVLNSSLLRKSILEDLQIPAFTGRIHAEAIAETNLLTMQVTDHNPRTAFLVAKSVIDKHHLVSEKILGDTILEVLQEPVVPMAPINPLNAFSSMQKGFLAACLALCVLTVASSLLKDTIRSKQEAENKLNIKVLSELHHERKKKSLIMRLKRTKSSILITNPTTSFSYVEEIRKLRRRVEQRMPKDGGVILVVSALENEGKSTVAANLALSLAQKHKRVLLMEGDMRRPALHKILALDCGKSGTVDVIRGKAALQDRIVHNKALGNLHVLPEKQQWRRSADIVSSDAMQALLKLAREQYTYVVVDTPPMAVGSDSECLASLADGVLLVIRQNAAPTAMIDSTLDVIEDSGRKLLGCVLNDVVSGDSLSSDHYGYGYGGYHYGRYSHYGKYGAYQGLDEGR